MVRLEDLQVGASVKGLIPHISVNIVSIQWFGADAAEVTYKSPDGRVGNELVQRWRESDLEIVAVGRPWAFDGDGELFRLVSEAQRIRLAHLFDPLLAVHSSLVDPLPHQITAVYEHMLPRQPLRFLLADDPGAGKTIMAGLLIKELIARGDLQRCLIVCPGGLAEQWQDELSRRFDLPFEILTNDKLEASRSGNWLAETDLVIARLDKLSRNESIQQKLQASECGWDLVVCDEAHKMAATVFGGETKYTKRYRLGELLSSLTRHFLLMSATPHNGKEADFQLFMALLDGDRFEGRYRDGVHSADVSDLMRRMVKENLLKFDGKPLFPKRMAYTLPYQLSPAEEALYASVTEYVRNEFDRAAALENDKRAGTVGFALTILQRRLASSPEAIYQSLRRRRERLESRLREMELLQRGGEAALRNSAVAMDAEDVADLEDAPESEIEAAEEQVLDQATAARSIHELRIEIETLKALEAQASSVRRSGADTKWNELAGLLGKLFGAPDEQHRVAEPEAPYGAGDIPPPSYSPQQKLVIFTEHRDTLTYLATKVRSFLGREDAVVIIHGGVGREERLNVQEAFRHDPRVQVLIATDAAGEGINLQRAHLMVNFDLPWNPNRLEQRFGRIHRIGQTETCYLWNLVAQDTREGDVYLRLLSKLEQARAALGGQVFDVLGKLAFEADGKVMTLRDLLIQAIRFGELPETRAYLSTVLDTALDRSHLQSLLNERQLVHDTMDATAVQRIRADMERAEARRLQPHYIESFFLEAFRRLGGTARQRESRRYEVSHVPSLIRQRDRLIGLREAVQPRYERIVFEKSLVAPQGQPLAGFVCPGHPLLDSVLDLTLERHRDLLRRGTTLVDENDPGVAPRVMFYMEHAVQDGALNRDGSRRVISKRMLYVEVDSSNNLRHLHYAPYLDYRPLAADDPSVEALMNLPEFAWITRDLEQEVLRHAIASVVPEHHDEVRSRKLELANKTKAAVKDRLTKEITYWDHRAEELRAQEQSGRPNARLNSGEARKRADTLQDRLQKRLRDLEVEAHITPAMPIVLGGLLVVPVGLLRALRGVSDPAPAVDTQVAAARARAIVMETERSLGFDPVDREFDQLGYDIESRVPGTGKLRFIEVKGRVEGADTITVTRNEVLYSLNKPDDFILAIVEFLPAGDHRVSYVRSPFEREPDFKVTSLNYSLSQLLLSAHSPS